MPRLKGTPRTRQSPLTLAAFQPWGSSRMTPRGVHRESNTWAGTPGTDSAGYHMLRRIRLVAYGARLERGLG